MNILLIGSGGREHAFAWKMCQSPHCDSLYIAPGNAGTALHGTNVAIAQNDFQGLAGFVREKDIQLVVVGPEEPLVLGIADYFAQAPDLEKVWVIGPSREAAQLEGSKAFAKAFMGEMNIPTASYREFTAGDIEEGKAYLAGHSLPIVLKADGLAGGKGVLICHDRQEAQQEFEAMLGGKFGAAGSRVVVETFLKGTEFSVFVLTDGHSYKVLPAAKDYKRIGEGDTGLNTGGMGAVSPVPFLDGVLMEKVEQRIIRPTIEGIQKRKLVYKGFIFLGLIEVHGEPYVIEYNCRMGDPETEAVLPRLKSDLLPLLMAAGRGELDRMAIEEDPRAAATVVLVSGGYPGTYEKGKIMRGVEEAGKRALVFYAGVRRDSSGALLSDGGRVVALTSLADTLKEALDSSKVAAEGIEFEGRYYRRDIGYEFI
ncbi:MAG: phosphoribosylamine--glycine ligase [Haliscomenobacter sp.]